LVILIAKIYYSDTAKIHSWIRKEKTRGISLESRGTHVQASYAVLEGATQRILPPTVKCINMGTVFLPREACLKSPEFLLGAKSCRHPLPTKIPISQKKSRCLP